MNELNEALQRTYEKEIETQLLRPSRWASFLPPLPPVPFYRRWWRRLRGAWHDWIHRDCNP